MKCVIEICVLTFSPNQETHLALHLLYVFFFTANKKWNDLKTEKATVIK